MAMIAFTSRSRSSIRWATKGCSVPASSSSWSFGVVDIGDGGRRLAPAPFSVELLRAVLCHARGAGQCPGAHAGAGLVTVRHRALLHAPLLLRVLVLGVGGRRVRQRVVRVGGGVLPL